MVRELRGAPRFRARRRRRRWVIGAGVAVLLVVIAGAIGLKLRSTLNATIAETDLARNQLLAGAHLLKTSGLGLTKEEAAQATADFSGAEAHFTHVNQSLTGSRIIGVFGRL